MKRDYISTMRSRLGKTIIILNFGVGIIKDQEGRILLQKRSDGRGWGLPGGAMELGESYAECTVREVYEETGLCVKVKNLLGIYSQKKYKTLLKNGDSFYPVVVAFYCCKIKGRLRIDNQETADLKYFSKNKLPCLVNAQHKDMILDAFKNNTAVWK